MVIDYVIALANLYGLVHKDKVIEIYNKQNDEAISDINIDKKELKKNFLEIHNDYFVQEMIIEYNGFEEELEKRKGKPYYIPERKELLKYKDGNYYEKNKEYKALLEYVTDNFPEVNAEILCDDIQGICQFAFSMDRISQSINGNGVIFDDNNQMNELMQLIMDLANNVRLRENNGFTPKEIFEQYEKPNLSPLPKDFNMKTVKKQKIGRNASCPCGSGKKYKKCCLN